MRRSVMATAGGQGHLWRKGRRIRNLILMACATAGVATYLLVTASAQTTGAPADKAQSAAPITTKPEANLLQLMRGVMFPESNVIFAAQEDVSKIPLAAQPAVSPNLLTSVFGGWQAVENSALGLAESTELLALPGRTCANGRPVQVADAAWVKYVNGMRAAALEAYKAAQAKSTDDMVDAAGSVSDSCMACHNVYRSNRAGMAGRCTATPPTTPQNPAANLPPA